MQMRPPAKHNTFHTHSTQTKAGARSSLTVAALLNGVVLRPVGRPPSSSHLLGTSRPWNHVSPSIGRAHSQRCGVHALTLIRFPLVDVVRPEIVPAVDNRMIVVLVEFPDLGHCKTERSEGTQF